MLVLNSQTSLKSSSCVCVCVCQHFICMCIRVPLLKFVGIKYFLDNFLSFFLEFVGCLITFCAHLSVPETVLLCATNSTDLRKTKQTKTK